MPAGPVAAAVEVPLGPLLWQAMTWAAAMVARERGDLAQVMQACMQRSGSCLGGNLSAAGYSRRGVHTEPSGTEPGLADSRGCGCACGAAVLCSSRRWNCSSQLLAGREGVRRWAAGRASQVSGSVHCSRCLSAGACGASSAAMCQNIVQQRACMAGLLDRLSCS